MGVPGVPGGARHRAPHQLLARRRRPAQADQGRADAGRCAGLPRLCPHAVALGGRRPAVWLPGRSVSALAAQEEVLCARHVVVLPGPRVLPDLYLHALCHPHQLDLDRRGLRDLCRRCRVCVRQQPQKHSARAASAVAGIYAHALRAEREPHPAAADGVLVGQARGVFRRDVLPRFRRRAVRYALRQEGRAHEAELRRHAHVHPRAGAAGRRLCSLPVIVKNLGISKKRDAPMPESPVCCTVMGKS